MGITGKMWDAITTVVRMNDKVERMVDTIKTQQQRIESMNERLIRLEMALQLGIAHHGSPPVRALEDNKGDGHARS
jgi:hypothetical protein